VVLGVIIYKVVARYVTSPRTVPRPLMSGRGNGPGARRCSWSITQRDEKYFLHRHIFI